MAPIVIFAPEKPSKALIEWRMKEEGSWEDSNRSERHPYVILKRFKGRVELTSVEALSLIESGEYHATAWNNDEIAGGKATKEQISNWVKRLKKELSWIH